MSADSPTFTLSKDAPVNVLEARILAAFTYPHHHPGIAGVAEGAGCPRCNAEKALAELVARGGVSPSGADEPGETPPFEECANCGSKASEHVAWNRTGGWTCGACGQSDYPEATE